MTRRSLSRGSRIPKLELSSLWPAVAAIVLASILLWTFVPRQIERSAAQQLGESLGLMTRLLSSWVDEEPARLQERISALATGSSLRLTLVSGDGTPIADSARSVAQVAEMDNHAGRPEIADALAAGSGWSVRKSATTGVTYAYSARTFTGPDGRLYVLRLAQPLEELEQVRRRLAWTMALAASAALVVAGLVFLWLSSRFFRPLTRLVEGAGSLASGEYRQRLEPPEEPHLAALTDALNRLASRVEEQIARVRAERDHLEAIVRSMSDGVLVTDREGRALLANPELRRLFDLEGDVTGRTPLELTRNTELADLVAATLARGEERHSVIGVRTPGRRTVALASTPLAAVEGGDGGEHGNGDVLGVVVVARDTTQATRLDEMRRDFVANVSHELKTPLSAIRAYAETLRDGALDDRPAAERFVARTIEQSRRLQALLDDLLTLSRLESLEERPHPEPVDLMPILRRAVEVVEEPARGKEVDVMLQEPIAPPPPVWGDRESLERLATNLLDNAVKYNRRRGRVAVAVTLEPEDGVDREAPRELVLEVADTGIGIPEESVPRIFERFYRVDKGRARDEGGTGLGLAIVKHVAQSGGGRVEVESEPGVGTVFRVHLPLAPPPPRP